MTKTTETLIDATLDAHLRELLTTFKGDARHLEAALGALLFGRMYGWKVLRLVHGASAYARYERLLTLGDEPFRFKNWLPEDTTLSSRSKAYQVVQAGANFWRVVNGVEPGRSSAVEG